MRVCETEKQLKIGQITTITNIRVTEKDEKTPVIVYDNYFA